MQHLIILLITLMILGFQGLQIHAKMIKWWIIVLYFMSVCSFLLLSGTQWPLMLKIWLIRCWLSILLNASQLLKPSNTPGSVYVFQQHTHILTRMLLYIQQNNVLMLTNDLSLSVATLHCSLYDAQTGNRGVLEEIQCQKETQG